MSRKCWNLENLKLEALKYNSRVEFQKGSKTAYNMALRKNLLDEICSHMLKIGVKGQNNPNFRWTQNNIIIEALKYKTRSEFKYGNPQAYGAAWRNNILNDVCSHMSKRKNIKKTILEIEKILEKSDYKLLSNEYKNAHQKLDMLCPQKHFYDACFNSFLSGKRCSKCNNNKKSKDEEKIFKFIKNFHLNTIKNDKKILFPKELDIYIPALNLAIEYCGVYWHNENSLSPRGRSYHYDKMKLCNQKGIRLITIFEDEWLERQEQVKNFLLSVINKNSIRLMARKTSIQMVPKKEAISFLENNHIQGSTTFEVAFGLYFNNELQAIVTGNKHHRQGHESLFVLNRLAFKHNTSISGGSSKLLKVLINYAKSKGYTKLISWSDNRWSEGNVYEKLGFKLTKTLSPDYSYVKGQKRLSKQSCQKRTLYKKGAIGNTEKEMALSLGLYRIWDCGKKRWEIDL